MTSEKVKKQKKKKNRKHAPFFPNSPLCVGSPTTGVQINRRTVRQLTPNKLCSLALPPPLLSLFDADGSIAAHGLDEQSVGNHGRHQPSNMSVSAGSTGTYNAGLPQHIRAGFANCDPLLAFDGQYVLVGTSDGRLAIYSIIEFDNDVSYDVKMSERRRRREWLEEDISTQQDAKKEEEKKIDNDGKTSSELQDEDNEWDIREKMNVRERARLIDPILVVTLPLSRRSSTISGGTEEDNGSANVFSPPTIIDICVTPQIGTSLVDQRLKRDGFLGHVAIVTEDGEVHVLEFVSPNTTKSEKNCEDDSTSATSTVTAEIILSFNTGNSHPTSICMRPADAHLRLCIGSYSGVLTEFRLRSPSQQESGNSSPKKLPTELTRQRSLRQLSSSSKTHQTIDDSRSTVKVTLCWRGTSDAPIRALSCPGYDGTKEQVPSLLVVGTEQRQHGTTLSHQHPPPGISLDMINVSLAESMWNERSTDRPNSNKVISLSECSVWPAAGMELKDGWLRDTSKRKNVVNHQLNSVDAQHVSTTSKICCFEGPSQCFASTSSDGTVAVSHYLGDGKWGITDENNQIMLFQKCIGMGPITSGNGRYIACCLRGGTIYLVPVVKGKDSRKEIVMYPSPVDSKDIGAIRYVHNFSAGLARVKSENETDKLSTMKVAAMIGWSGGTIDVYELPTFESKENLLLNKLAEKGILSKIVEIIRNMDENHQQLHESTLWNQAWSECKENNDVEVILNMIVNPQDDSFEATRLLILSLIDHNIV